MQFIIGARHTRLNLLLPGLHTINLHVRSCRHITGGSNSASQRKRLVNKENSEFKIKVGLSIEGYSESKRLIHCNEYTKPWNTPGSEKKLGKQVNQKLLYRESDWWDVVVQKARKQGTVC